MSLNPAPMTLGNMRANGMRTLAVRCLGRGYGYSPVLDVAGYHDDVPVPSFGPRLRCERNTDRHGDRGRRRIERTATHRQAVRRAACRAR